MLPVCYTHAHSMYFQALSAYGLLGLTGLLALFGIPLVFLLRRLRAGMLDVVQTQAAHMGVVLVLYTATASLTDLQIGYKHSLGLYCFLMALLLYWASLPSNPKERNIQAARE